MASLDPKDDKLHRALNMITEAVGILQNSPRSSQDIMPTSKASSSTVVVSDSVSGVRINTSATSSEPSPSTSQGTSSGQN